MVYQRICLLTLRFLPLSKMSTACSTMTVLANAIPSLSITSATPPRDPSNVASSSSSVQKNQTPRLLYRGALSLPDSNLTLDGLTFTISLPADDPQGSLQLLENPLPLALESMRGRPTLHFAGVEKLDNLYCDFSGGVNLYVYVLMSSSQSRPQPS